MTPSEQSLAARMISDSDHAYDSAREHIRQRLLDYTTAAQLEAAADAAQAQDHEAALRTDLHTAETVIAVLQELRAPFVDQGHGAWEAVNEKRKEWMVKRNAIKDALLMLRDGSICGLCLCPGEADDMVDVEGVCRGRAHAECVERDEDEDAINRVGF